MVSLVSGNRSVRREAERICSGARTAGGLYHSNYRGGLCQLSNALYDRLYTQASRSSNGMHTRSVARLAGRGRTGCDGFLNYVDLRFKSRHAFRIEACVDADSLIVRFKGDTGVDFLAVKSRVRSKTPGTLQQTAREVV